MTKSELIKALKEISEDVEVELITEEFNCSCPRGESGAGYCYCQNEETRYYINGISLTKDNTKYKSNGGDRILLVVEKVN